MMLGALALASSSSAIRSAVGGSGNSGSHRCHLGKSLWVRDGKFGQYLPVDLDLSTLQTLDETTVGQVVDSGSRIDPGDPQPSEISLSSPPIPVSILQGPVHGICCSSKKLASTASVTLGKLQYLLSSLSGFSASSDSHMRSSYVDYSLFGTPSRIDPPGDGHSRDRQLRIGNQFLNHGLIAFVQHLGLPK
jgi:hypothetical protein